MIVPVVVDERRQIDFGPIDAATRDIAANLSAGALVVYETTLPVGTTRGPVRADAGRRQRARARPDLFLAFSPERVLVGRVLLDLQRYPKIVGGTSDESTRRAVEFYRSVLDEGTEVWAVADAETAEMTKLAETTYRDVNIAYANELARFAARRGIDVTEVIGAANSQPYSHIHQPGVGVGGHCIPVYPHFLFNDEPDLRLPPLAREINEGMAAFAVDVIEDRIGSLDGQPVLVLGIAYRGDVNEDAFSSAFRLRDELRAAGATSTATTRTSTPSTFADGVRAVRARARRPRARRDPPGRPRRLRDARPGRPAGLELFVDGRNALDREPFDRAGVGYVGIGR